MRHGPARRRLTGLLDGFLEPREAAAVRGHLDGCRRCRRTLAEFEASEALLRRLPATLIPLDPTRASDGRLRGLARWAPARREPLLAPRRLQALGAVTAALVAVLGMALGPDAALPAAHPQDASRYMVVAVRMPATFLAPAVEASSAAVPYSWRQ